MRGVEGASDVRIAKAPTIEQIVATTARTRCYAVTPALKARVDRELAHAKPGNEGLIDAIHEAFLHHERMLRRAGWEDPRK